MTIEERFWQKVHKTESCWNWIGSKFRSGYGQFANQRSTRAHRFSYELVNGPIPANKEIDHLCRNRACVNPAHLEAVTAQTNSRRSMSVSGIASRKTHCDNGHPLSGANIRVVGTHRHCRACWRRNSFNHYHRKKSQRSLFNSGRPN